MVRHFPVLHFQVVHFQSPHHWLLSGTKLYYWVTEAYVCVNNLHKVVTKKLVHTATPDTTQTAPSCPVWRAV